MGLPCYLAMTAGEFSYSSCLPSHIAWMACHFSCYGSGIENLPESIPNGTMLILNDRIPPSNFNIQKIINQLNQTISLFSIPYLLLDMQRPSDETAQLVSILCKEIDCKVGVSALYASCTEGPVFLNCPPPHCSLSDHIKPWSNREIWQECAIEQEQATITKEGCTFHSINHPSIKSAPFKDVELCCHYGIQKSSDHIIFFLRRDSDDINAMLQKSEHTNISLAVGLYQQFKHKK